VLKWNLEENVAKCPGSEQRNILGYVLWCLFCLLAAYRGVFRPRQTRYLPREVDLKWRLLSCQSY